MVESKASAPGSTSGSGSRLAVVIVVALLVLLVVLVAAAGVVAWRLAAQSAGDVPPPTAPSTSAAPATSAAATPSPAGPSGTPSMAQPTGPWQSVTSAKDAMAYDVPGSWRPGPETLAGFESSEGEVQAIMHGVAFGGDDWCGPGSSHTLVGFVTPGSRSDKGTIEATATHWAVSAGQSEDGKTPTGSLGDPRPVELDDGRTTATAVTATTTPVDPECAVPTLEVTVVSVPRAAGKTALFVMVADRDVDGADSDATLARVIASIRPAR